MLYNDYICIPNLSIFLFLFVSKLLANFFQKLVANYSLIIYGIFVCNCYENIFPINEKHILGASETLISPSYCCLSN